ncbi:MAG: DNA polymerase I, partial [Sedimentisphaerales bacterium]
MITKVALTFELPFWLVRLLIQPALLYRRARYGYAFCRIRLTQGQYAIVDPDDYERLLKYKWHAVNHGRAYYAARSANSEDSKGCPVAMHREVVTVADDLLVDHINHNGLDNRKANLRPATHAQNSRNRTKCRDGNYSSGYKGVSRRQGDAWHARIFVDGRLVSLGRFESEIEAAKAYDRAAREYHGEFAAPNFPLRKRRLRRLVPLLAGAFLSYLACAFGRGDQPCDAFRVLHNPARETRPLARQISPLRPSSADSARNDGRGGRPGGRRVRPATDGGGRNDGREKRDERRRGHRARQSSKTRTLGALSRRQPTTKYQRRTTTTPLLTASRARRTVAAMAKELYIIDGHAHIYAAYFAPMRGQLNAPTGEPTKAVYIFTTALVGLIQRRKPDMLVVAMDSKAPTFRSDIYPEYKANRPPMPDDMPGQIDRIEQVLGAMNIPVLRVDGFEADDIIGTLAKRAGADGYDCLLCSKDKDLLQLLDKHVSMYDMKTDTVTDAKTMVEQMGVRPEQFVDCLALQGDTSDNVPGVPDVGPKTALSWIQKYGSIRNLYEHADEIKGKRGDNLRAFRDRIGLSQELVTIDCKVPLEIDYDDLALKEPDEGKLVRLFMELGFNRILSQMGLKAEESSSVSPGESHAEQQRNTHDAIRETKDYQLIDAPAKFETFFAEIKKQKLFAVDTETTSTEAMRADLVGLSFCWELGRAFYLPVRAPLGSKHLEIGTVRQKLGPILADESVKKIGQNIKYDMLVLQNAQMPVKGIYFDTMVASYCLDPERSHSMGRMAADFLGYECIPISSLIGKGKNQLTFDMVDTAAACEYSAEDADVTFRLYLYFKEHLEREPLLKKLFEDVEMPLVAVLAAMEFNGVSLDTRVLRKMSGEIDETLKTVTEQIYEQAGAVFNLDSPKQLAEILFDRLGLTPIRLGKTGRSTDAAVLERLVGQHPVIELVLQYRMLSKLKTTYVDKLGSLINPRTGRLHASFNQTIAATGRLSSSGPNLQNIPIRTELGSRVRSAFVPARKGDCILSADYSQIELRLLAHFSKDEALRAAFAADQ